MFLMGGVCSMGHEYDSPLHILEVPFGGCFFSTILLYRLAFTAWFFFLEVSAHSHICKYYHSVTCHSIFLRSASVVFLAEFLIDMDCQPSLDTRATSLVSLQHRMRQDNISGLLPANNTSYRMPSLRVGSPSLKVLAWQSYTTALVASMLLRLATAPSLCSESSIMFSAFTK